MQTEKQPSIRYEISYWRELVTWSLDSEHRSYIIAKGTAGTKIFDLEDWAGLFEDEVSANKALIEILRAEADRLERKFDNQIVNTLNSYSVLYPPELSGIIKYCLPDWRVIKDKDSLLPSGNLQLVLIPFDAMCRHIESDIARVIQVFPSGENPTLQAQYGRDMVPFVTDKEIGVRFVGPVKTVTA